MRQNFETGHNLVRWYQSTGVQLGHHAVQPQLLLQLLEAIDQTFAGAKGYFGGHDLIIAERGQPLGPVLSKLGGVDTRPAR